MWVFYYKVPISLLTFPKTVFWNHPPLPHIFIFWVIPSHIIMIQNQQEFKIQNYNVP